MTPQIPHPPLPPLAAALPEHPELLDSLVYQLNGLVVVFVALSLIWGLLETVGVFFRQRAVPAAVAGAPEPKFTPEMATDTPAISPDLAAAIAAAVQVSLGPDQRIAAIVPIEPASLDWALEGRRQIHSARKVR